RREIAQRYETGVGNLMWGNGFPHPEGTWPHTVDWLRRTFNDVPADETRQMLGLNAADCCRFDLAKLDPVVERVGPTPAELGRTDDVGDKWEAAKAVGRHWRTDSDPLAPGPLVR